MIPTVTIKTEKATYSRLTLREAHNLLVREFPGYVLWNGAEAETITPSWLVIEFMGYHKLLDVYPTVSDAKAMTGLVATVSVSFG